MKAETISRLERFTGALMDRSTAQRPAWNLELGGKGGENRWNYVDGCMISAFLQLYRASGKEKYLRFAESFVGEFLREDGSVRTFDPAECSLDGIAPFRVLFPLWELTGSERYRLGIETGYAALMRMPRTKEGNFWHKKIYPRQVWLDGLYMAMPFYMRYEIRFDGMRRLFDICSQFSNVEKRMRDPAMGLYRHGYDESRSAPWADKATGCSRSFWLRAEGWLLMALVDTLEAMDEQMYYEYRTLQRMLRELADALLPWQAEDGMFRQVVDRPDDEGNYPETSGTAMVACGLLKAVRLRLLPPRYAAFGKRAFYGTLERYFRDDPAPSLGGICLVAGLGGPDGRDGTPDYYYGEPVVENDGKGVAPFLMAFAELLREDEEPETPVEGRVGG